MIIRTILDTDLYKFTTSYAYIKLFPYAIGTFSFKDRDGTEYSDDNHKPVQHHLSAAWFLHQYRGRTVSGRRRAGRSKGRRQQDDRVQCVLLRDRGRSYAGGRRIFPADLQYNGGDQGACDKLHRRIGDDHAVLFVQPCVVLYAAIGRKNDGYVPV